MHFSDLLVALQIPRSKFDNVLTLMSTDKEEKMTALPIVSEVLRRHQSTKEANFVPIIIQATQHDEVEAPDIKTLAGRLYQGLVKWSSNIQFEIDEIENCDTYNVDEKICEMIELIKKLYADNPDIFEQYTVLWPPNLPEYWGRKKNRSYL